MCCAIKEIPLNILQDEMDVPYTGMTSVEDVKKVYCMKVVV